MEEKSIDKKFKEVKIFLNGKLHERIDRSKGNEIKSIFIEADGLDFIEELYKADMWKDVFNSFMKGIFDIIKKSKTQKVNGIGLINPTELIKEIKKDYK